MKYICHMFEQCWTRVALPKLDIHKCSLLILLHSSSITVCWENNIIKADQAVVSQQMLVITPDTTTVSTPNTDNLSLRWASWNATYVVFSIIVSSLTRHFFISGINSLFSDPLYSGPLFQNLTMCGFGSESWCWEGDASRDMYWLHFQSHYFLLYPALVLIAPAYPQSRQHLLEDIATGKFQC